MAHTEDEIKEAVEHYNATRAFLLQQGDTFEVTKIHPYDLMEMENNAANGEWTFYFLDGEPGGILLINGKAYFQTTEVPAKTKRFQ